jgi:Fuc2NAc and GlcNAc transferase
MVPSPLEPLIAAIIASVLAAMLSWWATGRVMQWAKAREILDIPNARSLHVEPVPRGGGIAIAGAVLAINALAIIMGYVSRDVGLVAGISAACYGTLGALDDYRSIKPSVRFLVQIIIAVTAVYALLIATVTPVNLLTLCVGAGLSLLLVWLVNLYNFMDGSDGLAAVQAISAGAIGACLAAYLGLNSVAFVAATIAGAGAGFVRWNWQPARIFMGDAGSYFLGALFGLLILVTALHGIVPWFWGILLAPFVTDATLTLFRRIARGENWTTPHRSHAYQRLIQAGWTHRQVAIGLSSIVTLLGAPCAGISVAYPAVAFESTVLAYTLIATLWIIIVNRVHPAQ